MKALDKERTRRYETATGLAKDVQRYLSGDAVEACPPTLGYRLSRMYRRNRTAVLVAASFALLLSVAALTSSLLAVRAVRAEGLAAQQRDEALRSQKEAETQRQLADIERVRAEEEKRAAETVRAFLQDDLLRQVDVMRQADMNPVAAGEFEIKHNPTVREMLDRAAVQLDPEQIEQKFPGMPFVQAGVLHAVADAYWGVAQDELGRPLIDRAVALYRATRGDRDPATLRARKSQLELSLALREMIDEYPHIRDYSLNAIPAGHRSLLDLYQVVNRPEKERSWVGETLETLDTLVKKKLAEGKFTPNLVTLLKIQILNLVAAGRHDDAVALYREVNSSHTPMNKAAADAWLKLSGSVLNRYEGKLQNGRMVPWAELRIPVLEQNLDALRKTTPSEPALQSATNALLFSYLYAGRKADVVTLTKDVIDRQKANGWRTDFQTVAYYGNTAKAVALAGRSDLAVEMSSAVLAGVQNTNPSAEVLATATFSLGFARSHAGEHADAEELFREAVRLQVETDAKHWMAAKYKAWLGFALHDQQKYADAEPVLLEAYAEWTQRLPDAPAWEKYHPLLAAGRLASLYEAIGKPSEAGKWKTLCDQK